MAFEDSLVSGGAIVATSPSLGGSAATGALSHQVSRRLMRLVPQPAHRLTCGYRYPLYQLFDRILRSLSKCKPSRRWCGTDGFSGAPRRTRGALKFRGPLRCARSLTPHFGVAGSRRPRRWITPRLGEGARLRLSSPPLIWDPVNDGHTWFKDTCPVGIRGEARLVGGHQIGPHRSGDAQPI